MKFPCPHCTQRLSTGGIAAGVTLDCPSCGKPITTPEAFPGWRLQLCGAIYGWMAFCSFTRVILVSHVLSNPAVDTREMAGRITTFVLSLAGVAFFGWAAYRLISKQGGKKLVYTLCVLLAIRIVANGLNPILIMLYCAFLGVAIGSATEPSEQPPAELNPTEKKARLRIKWKTPPLKRTVQSIAFAALLISWLFPYYVEYSYRTGHRSSDFGYRFLFLRSYGTERVDFDRLILTDLCIAGVAIGILYFTRKEGV